MEQAAPHRDGVGRRPGRRRPLVGALIALLAVAAALAVALPLLTRELSGTEPAPTPPSSPPPEPVHSLSIDFGIVTDPATDWQAIDARLDEVGATTVNLNAGRIEFTAFDWSAHSDAAAEPGTDHLAVAARALKTGPNGRERPIHLIVDAHIPAWIESDPSVAGIDADGETSEYTASATQLLEGEVGDRLLAYVVALAERYDTSQIEITELFIDTHTFGEDDLELFRRMTGAQDWPRSENGAIDTGAEVIGDWRSAVVAGLMQRIRTALDAARDGLGRGITLVLDVRVDWSDPAAGRPLSGHDYRRLLPAGVDLQLWAYADEDDNVPTDVATLVARLRAGGYDLSRFIVSVGLWPAAEPDVGPPGSIAPSELAAAVTAAEAGGVAAVNVTPYSLTTQAHWEALGSVWA